MSFWIALRYFFSRRNFMLVNVISIITLISIIFITTSMFIVLAIFNGFSFFHHDIYDKCTPDLKIEHAITSTFKIDSNLLIQLESYRTDSLIDFSKVLEREVIIQSNSKNSYSESKIDKKSYAIIRGVDENYKKIYTALQSDLDNLPQAIKAESDHYGFDSFLSNSDLIIVGQDLASRLGLKVYHNNQSLKIWYLKTDQNRIELDYYDDFKTSSIFAFGENTIDNIVISDIERLQKMFSFFEVSHIEIKVKNGNVKMVQEKLQKDLGVNFIVKNKEQQSPLIFKIIKTEKLVVYLIFSLIIIITMITLIGSILILINQKKQDIIIFNSLGYPRKIISSIFAYLGFLIVFFGFVLGVILGIILYVIQKVTGILTIETPLGIIPYPAGFNISDILIISCLILGIGLIISVMVSRLVFVQKKIA